jgi:hypothetical protein
MSLLQLFHAKALRAAGDDDPLQILFGGRRWGSIKGRFEWAI